MSSCLNSWGDCGNAYQDPGCSRAGTRKSRAPSGVERVSVGVEDPTGCGTDLRPQAQRGRRTTPAQVQVAVLEPSLFADLDVLIDLERQWGGLVEDDDVARDDLDLAGRKVGVLVPGRPTGDLAGDLHHVRVAHAVGDGLGPDDHLSDARGVPQVDERHAAVIAPTRDPAGQGDGLAGLPGPK